MGTITHKTTNELTCSLSLISCSITATLVFSWLNVLLCSCLSESSEPFSRRSFWSSCLLYLQSCWQKIKLLVKQANSLKSISVILLTCTWKGMGKWGDVKFLWFLSEDTLAKIWVLQTRSQTYDLPITTSDSLLLRDTSVEWGNNLLHVD